MSLGTGVGAERNLLDETPEHAHQLVMDQPILRNHELETLRQGAGDAFRSHTIDITWPLDGGPDCLHKRLAQVNDEAYDAVAGGINVLILSDRRVGPDRVPIPSLLAVSAVHHHLVRAGTRLRTGSCSRAASRARSTTSRRSSATALARSTRTCCSTAPTSSSRRASSPGSTSRPGERNIVKAIGKGLLKTISKMGISTIQSLQRAQIFEAVGLERDLIDRHFGGTASRIGGIGLDVLAAEALDRHCHRLPRRPRRPAAPWRRVRVAPRRRAAHVEPGDDLAPAARGAQPGRTAEAKYAEFARIVNEDATKRSTLRGLNGLPHRGRGARPARRGRAGVGDRQALRDRRDVARLDLDRGPRDARARDEPPRRRSNTGEGGEDPVRFADDRRSAIKQVASGRFGVTIHYLVNADQLQIKMAQGAKPGEGGQLPGHKVDSYIGRIRHSTPGVGSSRRRRTTTSTRSRTSSSSSTTCAARTRARRSRSSSSPRSGWGRSRRAWPRRTPTTCSSPARRRHRARRR
jgi:hypothetical protein